MSTSDSSLINYNNNNLHKSTAVSSLKTENDSNKEMKEYAETAMNELLGWYGYEKFDKYDSQALNLGLFSTESLPIPSFTTKKNKKKKEIISSIRNSKSLSTLFSSSSSILSLSSSLSSSSSSSSSNVSSDDGLGYVSTNTDKNTGHNICRLNIKNCDNSMVPDRHLCCAWCQKSEQIKRFTFKTINSDDGDGDGDATAVATFCSEICFTQFQKANFKRKLNKTCDWCHHVRHTVTYEDLQDGDSRYQFCSDKCLNQFKLDIFCRETKEYLEMHPHHHQDQPTNDTKRNAAMSSLITPDLWLRNCVSPGSCDSTSVEKSIRSSTPKPINTFSDQGETATSTTMKMASTITTTPAPLTNFDFVSSPPTKIPKLIRDIFSNRSVKRKKTKNETTNKNKDHRDYDDALDSSLVQQDCDEMEIGDDKSATPRISFHPNFSSVLPPHNNTSTSGNYRSSRLYSSGTTLFATNRIAKTTKTKQPATAATLLTTTKVFGTQSNDHHIPPLLPIVPSRSALQSLASPFSCLHNMQTRNSNSNRSPPPITTHASIATATVTTATTSTPLKSTSVFTKSLLPPTTILVPYPVILPLPVPIPIPLPIPVPIPIVLNNTPTAQHTKDTKRENNEQNRRQNDAAEAGTSLGTRDNISNTTDDIDTGGVAGISASAVAHLTSFPFSSVRQGKKNKKKIKKQSEVDAEATENPDMTWFDNE